MIVSNLNKGKLTEYNPDSGRYERATPLGILVSVSLYLIAPITVNTVKILFDSVDGSFIPLRSLLSPRAGHIS